MVDLLRNKLTLSLSTALTGLASAVGLYYLYFWHLTSLTPGLSPEESATRTLSASLKHILNYPNNAPYYIWQHFLQKLGHNQIFYLRLGSVFIALALIVCFYLVIKHWLGHLVALAATLLFASLPWLVVVGRTASPSIMYLATVFWGALFIYLQNLERLGLKIILLSIISASLLYTPGLMWFWLISLILVRRRLRIVFTAASWPVRLSGLIVFVLVCLPLGRALAIGHYSLLDWLALPHHWPSIVQTVKDIAWAGLANLWRFKDHIPLVLARLPLLSGGLTVLVFLGLASLYLRLGRKTIWSLALWLGLFCLLAGISQNWQILSGFLPFSLALAGFGLDFLYREWRVIFPRNPFAKASALTLICLVLIGQTIYAVRYGLLAWPANQETKTVYMLK